MGEEGRGRFNYNWILAIIIPFIFLLSLAYLVAADDPDFTVELTLPHNNTLELNGNLTFHYNVTRLDNNVTNCSLIFDNVINQTDTTITESVIQSFDIFNIPLGFHNWSVSCFDQAGNQSASEIRSLRVYQDSTPPIVVLGDPADSAEFTDGNLSLIFNVTDNGWIANCSLYTDLNGGWGITQTNYFVQQNYSVAFELENIPDDTTFIWNVLCYDFAPIPNYDWGNANKTVIVDNNDPEYETMPPITMNEDDWHYLNLSAYFSDKDLDDLKYSVSSVANVVIVIDNETDTAIIEPDLNWYGNRSLVFYAFDDMGGNVSSGNVTLSVVQQGNTEPKKIITSPSSGYNDRYGITLITCNATDDYNLTAIRLYTNLDGNWSVYQGYYVGGTSNSSSFEVPVWSEQVVYTWACKFEDGSNHTSWSQNNTVNVSIRPTLYHDIRNFTINHVDHNKTVIVDYSSHLNGTLILGNLTIRLDGGSVYFTKNLSQSSPVEFNDAQRRLLVNLERFRIRYADIFGGSYTVNHTETLNLTLNYYFGNNSRQISTLHEIRIKSNFTLPSS